MEESSYIIILDDDPDVHKIIAAATGLEGISFASAHELKAKAPNFRPKAVFCDIHLGEDITGLDIIPDLRRTWPGCPILVITADDAEETVVEALSTGADDFIRKPLQPAEVLARLQIRLRDVENRRAKLTTEYYDLTIQLAHSRVESAKGEVDMSPTEMNLLMALVNAAGSMVQRNALKRLCWGRVAVSESALDRKVFEVRKAIKALSDLLEIKTFYGKGVALLERKIEPSR